MENQLQVEIHRQKSEIKQNQTKIFTVKEA